MNEYEALWRENEKLSPFSQEKLDNRRRLASQFAWAIPNDEALRAIKDQGPVVEVGAGTGYWTYLLRKAEVDVIAYDIEPYKNTWCDARWSEVLVGGPEKVANYPDRSLLLVWPPYKSSMAFDCLLAYTGKTVVYVGEGCWGCTGDDDFHHLLENEKFWKLSCEVTIPQWYGLHDLLHVYSKVMK